MLLCLLLKPRLPKGLNQQPDIVNDDIGSRDDIADDSDDDDEDDAGGHGDDYGALM